MINLNSLIYIWSWIRLTRILWYNWRDIRHPEAGGAEVFIHQIMVRLANRGYESTLFTSTFQDSQKNENIDGVNVIRCGGKYNVYLTARKYFRKHKEFYDLVIDGVNTRPFLSPKVTGDKPTLVLFHQLAGKIWIYETPFPINYLFYGYLEKKWLLPYRETPTVTVSNSSKLDLEDMGFKKIFVIPEGLDVTPLSNLPLKDPTPTIVYIGRLKRHKLAQDALEAFSIAREHIPELRMWVIGSGPMLNELKNKFNEDSISFYGRINDEFKFEFLKKAHITLFPSIREGWGLVVTESNAMGTPTIGYNVHGLRDSVVDGKTGSLVKDCTPESMANYVIELLKDPRLLRKYSENALAYSKQFNWDNTTNKLEKIIKEII